MAEPLPTWRDSLVDSLEPFSRIKLIAMDLDGTLVSSGGSETRDINAMIRKLSYWGVDVTLATGRTLTGIRDIVTALDIQSDIPVILYNGSIVAKRTSRECLFRQRIPQRALAKILELSAGLSVKVYAYRYNGPARVTGPEASEPKPVETVLGWSDSSRPDHDPNGIRVQWQTAPEAPEMFRPTAIVIDSREEEKLLPLLQEQVEGIEGITTTRSREPFLEVRPPGSHKGLALKFLSERSNLSRDTVLAIGDNDNDAEMLAWSGIGVSVKDASGRAMAASDFYSEHGVASAVLEAMRLVRHASYYYERR